MVYPVRNRPRKVPAVPERKGSAEAADEGEVIERDPKAPKDNRKPPTDGTN
jgi:hypothetical protein